MSIKDLNVSLSSGSFKECQYIFRTNLLMINTAQHNCIVRRPSLIPFKEMQSSILITRV